MKNHINIIVVDSDPKVIKSAWKALSTEGYNVEGVLSGNEAIYRIKKNNYDLVFTDIKTGGINGTTLIKWIRQNRPAIGIVAFVDNPLTKTIKEAHKLGIISHMRKPFTQKILKDVTKKTIEWINGNALKNEQEEKFQPEMLDELDAVVQRYRGDSGHAIRVLLHAQEIFGYLPSVIQKRVAEGLNMYLSEIRSIVSFYSCFRTKPEIARTPCYVGGIERAWNGVKWMTGKKAADAVNEFIRSKNEPGVEHAPRGINGIERAWNSVTWMTGKKAADAVNEFIKCKQLMAH
jgi:CheY-like chemotaxis protein